jgi:RNA polymerase sigma factor (sigma-70 family)
MPATTTSGPRSDAQLLLAARKDPAAFTEFYRAHAEWVYRWFAGQVSDPALAADLTAETFAQALVSLRRFRGAEAGSGTAWLFGIGRNLLRRSYERRRVENAARSRLGMPVRELDDDELEAVDSRLDAHSLAQELGEALGSLPPELREAVELRVVDGLSYDEIALAASISEQNARQRVSRALRALTLRFASSKETGL